MNLLNSIHVAYFGSRSGNGQNVPLFQVLEGIRRGSWAGQIGRLRSVGKGSPEFEQIKRNLPAVLLSGTTTGGHKATDVMQHSGLVQIDIDKLDAAEVAVLRDRIGQNCHIVAAFISPSGQGVKAVMRIPPDLASHKAAFQAVAAYMRDSYGVAVDPACSNVNRLCFVSHDPAIVVNPAVIPLKIGQVLAESPRGEQGENSSTSLPATSYILHNSAFLDFPELCPLYQNLVTRRYGKPQRGLRNQAMVEIVSSCFCAVSPAFVAVFAEEYFMQHAEAFSSYAFDTYEREVKSVLAGCQESYPARLSAAERAAYTALDERERDAFRIAQSLSRCETDATVPPPLFHLSANQLAARIGVLPMQAWRIVQNFEKEQILKTEREGQKRGKGQRALATVYRWLLCLKQAGQSS